MMADLPYNFLRPNLSSIKNVYNVSDSFNLLSNSLR